MNFNQSQESINKKSENSNIPEGENINFEKRDLANKSLSNKEGKEDSIRAISNIDNEITFKNQIINQTKNNIDEIRTSLGLSQDKNLDIPSVRYIEDKISILEEEKSKLNSLNNTKSGWDTEPLFSEAETFSWDNIPNNESKLSDQEKLFQDYDSKINNISNILKNAQFLTVEELEKINGGIIPSFETTAEFDFKEKRLSKILEEIDFSVFSDALNSPYKYKCFEKIEELKSGLVPSKISTKIETNIAESISKIIHANPDILDLKDFLKEAQKVSYSNSVSFVEYQGETYYKNQVLEGAIWSYMNSQLFKNKEPDTNDTENNENITRTMNETVSSVDMDDILTNQYLYMQTLNFVNSFGNNKIKDNLKFAINKKMSSGSDYDAQNILNSDIYNIKLQGENIAKNKIESDFGIANYDLNVWRGNGIKYNQNLNIMKQIEITESGSVKKLFKDYGIMEFHRYPVEILIDQIKEESAQNPYGVVVFPRSDHNEAFDNQTNMLRHLYFQTKGKYGLKIMECESKFDLARKFISLDDKYGKNNKISFVLLGGHGSGDSISLGSSDPRLNNFNRETAKGKALFSTESNNASFKKANERFLDKDAEIMFLSCSTGEEGGIAEKFSGSFDKKIVAPKIPVSKMDLKINYDDNGKPHFDVIYNNDKNLSAEYQSGIAN